MLRHSLLLIAVSALVWSVIQAQTGAMSNDTGLLRGPYLQRGTPHSIVIRWRTNQPSTSLVRYGTSPARLTQVANKDQLGTEHEVMLIGLEPDTRYYYSIGTRTHMLAGGDRQTFFQTAPVVGANIPVRIWAIGDAGTADDNAAAVYNAYRGATGDTYTNLFLMLGDNAYSDGTDEEYQRAVFDLYPDILAQSVVWPTLGNHEAHAADSATQSGAYYDIFTLPTQGEAGGVASHTEAYYAYDYANIHVIVLDSADSPRHRWSQMMQWLEADLQATTADWIIAYWHHSPYTKGSHDADFELELIQMRYNAVQTLEHYGVDLVLAGHSHSYERSKFIDGHYSFSFFYDDSRHAVDVGSGRVNETGAYNKSGPGVRHAGAVYVVVGSSGKTGGGPLNHPAMYISFDELGSLVIDIDALTLNAQFLDASGVVRDYFTIQK
jgi:hypothetical protein